jgi:hypothetical protein
MKIDFVVKKYDNKTPGGFVIKHDRISTNIVTGVVIVDGCPNFVTIVAKRFDDLDKNKYTILYHKEIEFIQSKEYRIVFKLLSNMKYFELRKI